MRKAGIRQAGIRLGAGMTGGTIEPYRISRVPTLICHCEEHSDVAISMRFNTRRRTAVATATKLPRRARHDKAGTPEVPGQTHSNFRWPDKSSFPRKRKSIQIASRQLTYNQATWIPAFAGMTGTSKTDSIRMRLPCLRSRIAGRVAGKRVIMAAVLSPVPTLMCHCEEHCDVAISMRLNTRRRSAVATPTRLPRYARHDKGGTDERKWYA